MSLLVEERLHLRQPFLATIEYSLNSRSPDEIFRGVVNNICKHGLGLNVFKHIAKGEEVIIKSELPNRCNKAVVRWIEKADKDLYRVGLECQQKYF